jgi:UDP-N-acetylglucosamine diphosphorylase/glucosamine-1-phosphate N-acetyltransferase
MRGRGVRIFEDKTRCIEHVWDLIELNGGEIVADFHRIRVNNRGTVLDGVRCLNSEDVVIEQGSTVQPGVVIDATAGPVFIGSNVKIYPHVFIEGPAFVGDGSLIKAGARIYGGTSIGKVCKIGGEVEKSIFHSYSNKQHDGYIGLSYIGSWCNLGAGTSTSDLKNNYGSIRMRVHNRMVDTGRMFLGAVIGDHTKTGINTIVNTGSIIGIMVNIFGAYLSPKYIPSFTWASDDGFQEYRLDKAIEVARRVMNRRGKTVTPAIEALLSTVFTLTEKERHC